MPKAKAKPKTERALPTRRDRLTPLGPNEIVRLQDGHLFFGLRGTQIDEHIQKGDIPPPIKLSDSGRGRGWLGSQIIAWQNARLATPRPVRVPRESATGKAAKVKG
jgi:predicted DNA-binding transcriptional regulator AlpA